MDVKKKLKERKLISIYSSTNDIMKTNYVEVKIYNTQVNRECEPYGDRDEIANHTISECIKLA